MENYKFIANEEEMEWFFTHVLDNLNGDPYHSYLACIATRPKKLTAEEREHYGISGSDGVMMREEIIKPRGKDKVWSFPYFKQHIARYECRKDGHLTKTGLPYPEKTLAVMIYAEPTDERKVGNFILNYGLQIQKELSDAAIKGSGEGIKVQMEKLANISKKIKSCHAENTDKRYVHFDFDIRKDLVDNEEAINEAARVIHKVANYFFGEKSTFIIRTRGGFHLLVKSACLAHGAAYLSDMPREEFNATFGTEAKQIGSNPIKGFISLVEENYSYTFEDEDKVKEQKFVPLPGSWMYGSFVPHIINKEDFE
jgi:hypothetical protein